MVGVFSSQSLHFYKVSLLFLLFFPLYSFLQAGRFTTKRQRESPINLVANHALDSSVDLCLCPSVCIFFFPISSQCIHLLFISPSPLSCQPCFFCSLVDTVPHSHLTLHHSYFFNTPFLCTSSNVVLLHCFSDHQGI